MAGGYDALLARRLSAWKSSQTMKSGLRTSENLEYLGGIKRNCERSSHGLSDRSSMRFVLVVRREVEGGPQRGAQCQFSDGSAPRTETLQCPKAAVQVMDLYLTMLISSVHLW